LDVRSDTGKAEHPCLTHFAILRAPWSDNSPTSEAPEQGNIKTPASWHIQLFSAITSPSFRNDLFNLVFA
jgi:hypothetical protein